MNSSLEAVVRAGESWAEKRLRDGSFMGSVQRHIPGSFPSSQLASMIESLTKSFGAAYALEREFGEVVESKQRGVNKQKIVTYEVANSVMTKVKPLANVKLTTKQRDLQTGSNTTEYLLEDFINNFKEIDYEGLIKGEQGIINYVVEHFNTVRNSVEQSLPQYLLKEDLFNNRVVQEAGSATDTSKELVSVYKSAINFSDFIGGKEKKERINRQVFQFMRNREKWRALTEQFGKAEANVRTNIAFDGETGTGKSYFCKAIAGELDAPVYFIKGADFIKKYIGEGKDRMEDLYKQASSHGIGVIVIEEADVIGISRDNEEAKHKRDVINTWLTLLEEGVGDGKVVTVINTNRLYEFDDAVLDRFPLYNRFTFKPMSKEMASKIMQYHIDLYKHDKFSKNEIMHAANIIDNDSLRGLGDISYLASCFAMERDHSLIKMDDLTSAINDYQGLKQ